MVMRSLSRRLKSRSRHSRSSRLAWLIGGVVVITLIVLVVRNLQRHDDLAQWRVQLEKAAGSPDWPSWSSKWPDLPVRRRRHGAVIDLRGPYAFAATRADLLDRIPCFCGCVASGHRSVLSCFVIEFATDGTPIWTDHSFGCEMCVHIAREVMLMATVGMSIRDIRAEIDSRYAHGVHPPTKTPRPTP